MAIYEDYIPEWTSTDKNVVHNNIQGKQKFNTTYKDRFHLMYSPHKLCKRFKTGKLYKWKHLQK